MISGYKKCECIYDMKMGHECTDSKTYPSRVNSHKYTSVISGSVYVYPCIGKLLQLTHIFPFQNTNY